MAKCEKCGEEHCEEKRAAFAREPWLPGGFEIGAQWVSLDGGLTWTRFATPAEFRAWQERGIGDMGRMTVTGIDQATKTVTVKVG